MAYFDSDGVQIYFEEHGKGEPGVLLHGFASRAEHNWGGGWFEAYWGDDEDISKDEVLTDICEGIGVDPQLFFAGISDQAIKDQLKANTDEVMARGGFGSPTIFLDKTDMYFGNDRLPLIRDALARRKV